jgi:RNA polymerase sigma factor (sigma-70 family)
MSDPLPETSAQPSSLPHDARLEALVRDYARLVRHAIHAAGGRRAARLAEDIEQRVFLSLWRQVQREQIIDHPASYLYRAAVHETLRVLRKAERRGEIGLVEAAGDLSERASPVPDPEERALASERMAALRDALGGLAPERALAVRGHLRGFSVPDLMELFGWSYQKARNLVARGMSDLRSELRRRGLGDI